MSRIYCFSSTGNSLYVANRIAKQINASVISMTKKTYLVMMMLLE